jgi:AcrR family transcriptional regulator
MAKPLIPADDILAHAMKLLNAEGVEALNVRRIAADLKISPRTFYQQVGNQEALVRALVSRHFTQLRLDFVEYDTWESTALHWCLELNDALRANPFVTELITVDDRGAVTDYVQALLKSTVRAGIPRSLAIECCRGLANLTINHAIAEARALREAKRSVQAAEEVAKIDENYPRLVGWIVAAVRAEAESKPARRSTPRREAKPAKRSSQVRTGQ